MKVEFRMKNEETAKGRRHLPPDFGDYGGEMKLGWNQTGFEAS